MKNWTPLEAANLLNALGDTPDEIAANLRGAGFKGRPKDGQECPCGACLREHFEIPKGERGPHVGRAHVTRFYLPATALPDVGPLSTAMQRFVAEMDAGAYRVLIAAPKDAK
jgi:hypothetical protein